MGPLTHLAALERVLMAKAWPALSPWWRETLLRFYVSARRQIVLRCGRRGGKSSTLCRVAVLEALYGQHVIPPGDIGVVAVVSLSRDEAAQRLRTIKAILDALGVRYRPVDGGIELVGRPVAFKVYTATVAGVSGFTCICAICDEVAKWRDSDTGANPASEVLASLRPTMATQPNARIFLSSSPLGMEDAHAVAFDQGETDFQSIAYAPSWEANPTITEAATHALESNLRAWTREYKAIPQAGALSALDEADVTRAMGRQVTGRVPGWFGVADPASGGSDRFTFAIVGLSDDGLVVVRDVRHFDGAQLRAIGMAGAVNRIADHWRAAGVSFAFGDQREGLSLVSLFAAAGVGYTPIAWTNPNKVQAVAILQRWLADSLVALPDHALLRSELLAFEERITPSGSFTYAARRSGHDDFVALLLTAALAAQLHGALYLHRRAEQIVAEGMAAARDARARWLKGGGIERNALAWDRLLKGAPDAWD